MASDPGEVNLPFRWNLVRPDALGTLLEGQPPATVVRPSELTSCAAKVLARSGGGRLVFVGRSADSIFDFLSGVLDETTLADRISTMPFSQTEDISELTELDVMRARKVLAACDVRPENLVRGKDPVALIDLLAIGRTFTGLYHLLRDWVDEERISWSVARRKLRFVGITRRTQTSPNKFRWHQHADWVRELPGNAVTNIALDEGMWMYWANHQPKLTRSFHRGRWAELQPEGPRRDPDTVTALAEAVALVEFGRTDARSAVARVAQGEPAIKERWLRDILHQLK